MCYGSKAQVSSIVRKYVQEEGGVDWICGREFWQFISDVPECIDVVYEIARSVANAFRDASGQSLSQVLEEKTVELTAEFVKSYGTGGKEMWERLLARNS
jgi:hypothetical protein